MNENNNETISIVRPNAKKFKASEYVHSFEGYQDTDIEEVDLQSQLRLYLLDCPIEWFGGWDNKTNLIEALKSTENTFNTHVLNLLQKED